MYWEDYGLGNKTKSQLTEDKEVQISGQLLLSDTSEGTQVNPKEKKPSLDKGKEEPSSTKKGTDLHE